MKGERTKEYVGCVCVCVYKMKYYAAIKKKKKNEILSFAICNNVDGPGGHYA